MRPSRDVAVDSEEPKFSPDIVSKARPLNATFGGYDELKTGASKVKIDADVPTTPLTVVIVRATEGCTPKSEHKSAVEDVHEVV